MISLWHSWPCRDGAAHDLDINLHVCRRCFLTFEALHALGHINAHAGARRAATCVPSDLGLDGAIPLPPDEWHPTISEEGWAAQNRKINDLLSGRGT